MTKQTKQPEIVEEDLLEDLYFKYSTGCKECDLSMDMQRFIEATKQALQSQADKTRGEVLEEVRKMRREPWQNEFDDRDLQNQKTGYNEAIDDVINKLKKK